MLATFDRFATEIEGEYDGTARRIRYRAGALGEACGYEATRLGSDAPWLCLQMDTREAVRPIVEGGYWVDSQPNGEPDVLPVGCFGRAQREGDCDY